MSILNKLNIFNGFEQQMLNNIKMFYVPNKNEALFVTYTDQVFRYHYKQLSIIRELCDKRVTKFTTSICGVFRPHYMALTDNGCVYSWGYNSYGQLGNQTGNDCKEPELIACLIDYYVIDICCGKTHSLILTRNGYVFTFGDNCYGQCGTNTTVHQLIPIKIDFLNAVNVVAIGCGFSHSIALSEDGKVFAWGCNKWGQLGIGGVKNQLIPVQLIVPPIMQLSCGPNYSIMLSIDGNIYFCGNIMNSFKRFGASKINNRAKFIEIAASIHSQLIVALSIENGCFVFGKCRNELIIALKRTDFLSIDEAFSYLEQITYKTTELNSIIRLDNRLENVLHNKKKSTNNSIKLETVATVFQESEKEVNEMKIRNGNPLLMENRYTNCFTEICSIGIGGFSTVFKADHKVRNKLYAIKKIGFAQEKLETVSKEWKILLKLKSKYVVKYIDSWIEKNYYVGSCIDENCQNNISSYNLLYSTHFPLLLHIQMELCPITLKHAIIEIKKLNTLSLAGYYVACELMIEILECVQYLHSQNPSIIHRDLKPENILLTNFVGNRFVKLADFGLSTFHEFADQSHTMYSGTKNYRAPEVNTSSNYTTKADIFSLGIIMQELFGIDFSREVDDIDSVLAPKYNYAFNLIVHKLQSVIPNARPHCCEILRNKYLWGLTIDDILDDELVMSITSTMNNNYTLADNFIEFFIDRKYNDVV